MIETTRLIIIPATIEMLKSEINEKSKLSVLLGAVIPNSWPPETLVDAFPWFIEQLERNPGQDSWYCWYALLKSKDTSKNILVGSVGFKGRPDNSGTVEIGYSVLNEYQGKSIATEMVSALTKWAFSQSGVNAIIAETTTDNFASSKVLKKCEFMQIEQKSEALFFQLKKSESDHQK